MMNQSARLKSAVRASSRLAVVVALASTTMIVESALSGTPSVSAAGNPNVQLTKSAPANALYGDPITATLSATTIAPASGPLIDGFNLSFTDVLPEGAIFGSSSPAPNSIIDLGAGGTALVWENVADILSGATVELSYTYTVDESIFDIGDDVVNNAGAYVSSDPRDIPDFDPLDGSNIANDETDGSDTATATTRLVPFEVEKIERSRERELLRGVHDNKTTYTLTINNNQLIDSEDFTLVDYLPSGLEFLGCSAVDNSTAGTEEYPGSGRIDDTGHPSLSNPCATPTSVTTVTDPGTVNGVAIPAGVYTRVEWNANALIAASGTDDLTPAGLAAGASVSFDYAAAIPLRRNTQASLANPTANLDNNTGTLTSDEQGLRNYVFVGGVTESVAYTDGDTRLVVAEDISIHKTVDQGAFVQGADAVWTLEVETGEYLVSTQTGTTVTDTIPNGTEFASSDTALSSGPTNNADGTQTVEWLIPPYAAPGQTTSIQLTTTALTVYRPPLSGPVSSADTWTNSVALTTTGTLITGNDGSTTPGNVLLDTSAAAQTATAVTILKEVSDAVVGTMTCGDGSGLVWNAELGTDYREKDRVCWRLNVVFPGQLDTLSPLVQDYLPLGYEFESWAFGADHNLGTGVTYDGSSEALGLLTWDLDDADATGDRFQVVISSLIDDASSTGNADVTANLMKFSFLNTNGNLFQHRDEAEARVVEPVLLAEKSADPDTDVNGGDVVDYTVTISNEGFTDAINTTIVDTLPTDIVCADITVAGAVCADNGVDRSTITWTNQTVPRGTEVAPAQPSDPPTGQLDEAGELVLTYQMTLPDTFDPAETLVNNVAVTEYQTDTNTGSIADRPTYTDGPTAEETVTVESASFTKSSTTGVSEPGNDAATALAIGEEVTYTLAVNIPVGTTTTEAVITDTLPTGIRFDSSSATLNGAAVPTTGAGAFTLAGTTLTFPDPYEHSGGAGDDVIILTIVGTAEDVASNTNGTNRDNDANFSWSEGSIDDDVRNRIVEPVLSVVKTTDDADDEVIPGQDVEYTLTISNSGSVAHDLVITDELPDDVLPLSGGLVASDGDTIDGTGGAGIFTSNATQREIVWNISSVSNAADLVLTYDTRINNPLTGGILLTNAVDVVGSSLAGVDPDERGGYSADTTKTIEAPVISVVSKVADVSQATVGDLVEYELKVAIPADIEAFDLTILDDLPAGTAFEAFVAVQCAEPEPLPGPNACTPGRSATSLNSPGDTGTIGFFVGDINPGSSEAQVLTFVYTVRVLDDATEVNIDLSGGRDLDNSARAYSNITEKIAGTPAAPPASTGFDSESDPVVAEVDVIEPRLVVDKDVAGQVGDSDARRAKPGDTLTYSVTVTNNGTSPAHDVTITDTPDSRLTGYAFTPVAGVVNTDADSSDGTLAWFTAGPIASSASMTLTYTLTVPDTLDESDEVAGAEVVNTADIPTYFGASSATRAANPTVSYRSYTVVPADTVDVELDLASIGDRVWYDRNGDGIQDAGEPGLNGVDVTVTFLNGPGSADDESVTVQTQNVAGTDGVWLVEELPGGAYTVEVNGSQVPSGLTPSYDLDDGTNGPDGDWAGTLAEDAAKRDVDAGFNGSGSIGDVVWFDQDLSGSQNGDEGGIPNIDVTLVWAGPDGDLATTGDNVSYTDTTDSNGAYLFIDLPAGLFSVTLDGLGLPAGMGYVSDPDAGTADGTALVTLTGVGDDDLDQDFGLAGAGRIGDTIYLDRDGDGAQAASGEAGIEGALVTLVYAGPDGVLGGAGASDDETYTDTTDANGEYRFDNLPASKYSITVSNLPGGSTNSADPDSPLGAGDSTSLVTLGDGTVPGDETDLDQDFGYDVDSALGDRVWWDLDRDGVQDAGEPGIGGVTVTVTYRGVDDSPGGVGDLTFTTTTSGDGSWSIVDIPDGDYTVAITGGVPAGFTNTYDADDGIASPNSSSDLTLSTLDEDQDFGFAGNSSIGDTVWLDLDGDGTVNGDEVGIADVTVNITWAGPDGDIATTADNVTFARTTDDDGEYLVEGLPVGGYSVSVDETTLPNAGAGMTVTYDQVGGTAAPSNTTPVLLAANTDLDTIDFGYRGDSSIGDTVYWDRNDDGDQDVVLGFENEPGFQGVDVRVTWAGPDGTFGNGDDGVFTVETDVNGAYLVAGLPAGSYRVDVLTATLPAGLENTADEDGDEDSNTAVTLAIADAHLTADFGYTGAASIGDTIYLDLDGNGAQGASEPGVPGQTVTLNFEGPDGILGNADDIVLTTVTGTGGSYSFDNLPDGDYRVTVVGGIADDADNTGDPDSGVANQSDVQISGGTSDDQQDFGYQGDNSLGDTIWWDVDRNGVIGSASVEPRLEAVDVQVTYAGADGVLGGLGAADDITVATVATDSNGIYLVAGLPDGDYRVDVVTSTLPAGMDNTADADDGVIGDGGSDPDSSTTVNLSGSTADLLQDFGYAGTGSIGDVVYFDRDGSGVRGSVVDEPGISGAEVTLTFAGADGVLGGAGAADDIVIVQNADANGEYDFTGLPAGGYTVAITDGLPSGAVNSDDPDLAGSAPDTGDSMSSVTLGNGEDNNDQDFGFDVDAGLGDRVWWDFDRDGVQDPNEPGIDGVEITVTFFGDDGVIDTDPLDPTNDDEVFVTTTSTVGGTAGSWSVTNIPEGNYQIAITGGVPADFTSTSDPDTGIAAPDGVAQLAGHTGLNVSQDFGLAGNSSIGDLVWLDLDGNGVLDGQEVGLEGVVVELTWFGPDGVVGGGDDQVVRTTTDANGGYLFEGLPAGEYSVVVDPDGDTLPDGLAPASERDATLDGATAVTLATNTAIGDADFGYQGSSSIGNTLYFDRDGDGTHDPAPGTDTDEPGLAGVEVQLTWAGEDDILGNGDDHVFTTTTSSNGGYRFTGIPAGEYVVTVVGTSLLVGLTNTDDEDGDDNGVTPVTLGVADDHDTADFGYAGAASIGDTIYLDLDGDGVQGPNEPGVPGQTVTLDGPVGTLTATTGPDGSYSFDNLPDGPYTVTVTGGIVNEAINTIDFDSPLGSADSTSAVSISGGVSNDALDFGYQGSAVLGDTVFFDLDGDGIDDGAADDPRLVGVDVVVTWLGPDGVAGGDDDVVIPVAPTDANGNYTVAGLPSGTYTVAPDQADIPVGLSPSNTSAGTTTVTLATGETNNDQDFGFAGTGSIGNTVWLDTNGDGVRDADELGIEGATVTLTWFGPDGVPGGGDDLVYVTTVDDSGSYLFEHLPAGEFELALAGLPRGLDPTADPDGGDDSLASITLASGQDLLDQEFGYIGTAGVGDTVFLDTDDNGIQDAGDPGLPGVTVTVTSAGSDGTLGTPDDLVFTTTTDANGMYQVTAIPAGPTSVTLDASSLPPGVGPSSDADGGDLTVSTVDLSLGETNLDQDFAVIGEGAITGIVFADTDGDGVVDAGEPGTPGVTVTITYDSAEGPVVITTTTDSDGGYAVLGLPDGPYTVAVLPADQPTGVMATTPTTTSVTLTPANRTPARIDTGFVEPGSIGDTVYFDGNGNGRRDPGDNGVLGVTVRLLDAAGVVVATTLTDADGTFLFSNLPPGTYTVELDSASYPDGLRLSADTDGTLDGNTVITIGEGDNDRTAIFGLTPPSLPSTGSNGVSTMLRIAGLLLAAGFVLLVTRRRRDDASNEAYSS